MRDLVLGKDYKRVATPAEVLTVRDVSRRVARGDQQVERIVVLRALTAREVRGLAGALDGPFQRRKLDDIKPKRGKKKTVANKKKAVRK